MGVFQYSAELSTDVGEVSSVRTDARLRRSVPAVVATVRTLLADLYPRPSTFERAEA